MATITLSIALLALLFAVYIGLGGRALCGHHKHPEQITGTAIVLSGFDSTNLTDKTELRAVVVGHDGEAYVLETDIGQLNCTARHKGYALSLLATSKRRRIAVNIWNGQGKGDIALAGRAI